MPEKSPQAERFAQFLIKEEQRGVVRLFLTGGSETCGSPIGADGWYVLDVRQWWEDAKEWHEEGIPGSWMESAFFMVLRRIGFRAMNEARSPARVGFDFGLKRDDVDRSGAAVLCLAVCCLRPYMFPSRKGYHEAATEDDLASLVSPAGTLISSMSGCWNSTTNRCTKSSSRPKVT
jgi:hypothetical protein